MLSTVRKALADAVRQAMPDARVVAYPPRTTDVPGTGVYVYVRPAESEHLSRWLTFDPATWAQVRYELVFRIRDDNPERAADLIDDIIDPIPASPNALSAIRNDPTLGITAYKVDAQPLFESTVEAAERVSGGDKNAVTYWEVVYPVQIVVNTLTAS